MSGMAIFAVVAALLVFPDRCSASLRATAIVGGGVHDRTAAQSDGDGADDPLGIAACFDLLGACLRAGLPVAAAVSAVAPTAPPGVATSLRRVADLLALGADPDVAWAEMASDPQTEALARMARRSARSGSSLAASMSELAERSRGEAEDVAAAAAERAGVLISGPLGLCFLPAFVALGIIPVVIGLATTVLGNGLI
ncbi:pilus assembly protein TadC [Rhodococcus sp. 27YEA15]|uniref:type II secretion system F family protein n=1 Tax=Rhodococcus sp. 27YEA15 TaxID=3156259 RepID=UPI003C7D6542